MTYNVFGGTLNIAQLNSTPPNKAPRYSLPKNSPQTFTLWEISRPEMPAEHHSPWAAYYDI